MEMLLKKRVYTYISFKGLCKIGKEDLLRKEERLREGRNARTRRTG
jgi:hypothetical protein